MLPRIGSVAEHRALGGGRHRVFGGGRPSQNIDAGRLQHVGEIRPRLDGHACAQTRTKLDLATLLVSEHILDEKRHAAEGAGSQGLFVEFFDAIGIKFDDRVDLRIDLPDGSARRLGQLLGAHLFPGHQLGQAQGVVGCIFGQVHGGVSFSAASNALNWAAIVLMHVPGSFHVHSKSCRKVTPQS